MVRGLSIHAAAVLLRWLRACSGTGGEPNMADDRGDIGMAEAPVVVLLIDVWWCVICCCKICAPRVNSQQANTAPGRR